MVAIWRVNVLFSFKFDRTAVVFFRNVAIRDSLFYVFSFARQIITIVEELSLNNEEQQ